jgi:uncharacterized protein YacL
MVLRIIKVVFILACGAVGYLAGKTLQPELWLYWAVPAAIGVIVAGILIFIESRLDRSTFERLMPPVLGLFVGLVAGEFLVRYVCPLWFPNITEPVQFFMTSSLMLVLGYFGLILGVTKTANLGFISAAQLRDRFGGVDAKILDTSVIIDGRVADIVRIGFIEGRIIIPSFVLKELQQIADSADSIKRARGRRGLDIVHDIQKTRDRRIAVDVVNEEIPDVAEVDAKLVTLAKKLDARIVTNDFNLNKVAQIQGVSVLNINDLANALKPAVLPDETITVKLIKEGKEPAQGVGYLDDGTMIVVDGGKHYLGQQVSVVVTSVLQTAAGRMIFARIERVLAQSRPRRR